ncbi:hypothetical protein SNEBB_002879 [Seison nebaliae]|nr:hypothetical protein SNEBB_002879 [Seison nebaliae]
MNGFNKLNEIIGFESTPESVCEMFDDCPSSSVILISNNQVFMSPLTLIEERAPFSPTSVMIEDGDDFICSSNLEGIDAGKWSRKGQRLKRTIISPKKFNSLFSIIEEDNLSQIVTDADMVSLKQMRITNSNKFDSFHNPSPKRNSIVTLMQYNDRTHSTESIRTLLKEDTVDHRSINDDKLNRSMMNMCGRKNDEISSNNHSQSNVRCFCEKCRQTISKDETIIDTEKKKFQYLPVSSTAKELNRPRKVKRRNLVSQEMNTTYHLKQQQQQISNINKGELHKSEKLLRRKSGQEKNQLSSKEPQMELKMKTELSNYCHTTTNQIQDHKLKINYPQTPKQRQKLNSSNHQPRHDEYNEEKISTRKIPLKIVMNKVPLDTNSENYTNNKKISSCSEKNLFGGRNGQKNIILKSTQQIDSNYGIYPIRSSNSLPLSNYSNNLQKKVHRVTIQL